MRRTLLAAAVAAAVTYGCGSAHSVAVDPAGAGARSKVTGLSPASYGFNFFRGPAEDYGHQMTAGPDGNVWFRDTFSKKIGFITPLGSVTEFSLPQGHAVASGIAAGPDGNIWYTEAFGHSIGRVTLGGSVTLFSMPFARLPVDITGGADGNVWFTVLKATSNRWWIGKITPLGTLSFYAVPGTSASLNDITLGPDGNVWYANGGSKTIGRVTPSGSITEFQTPNGITPRGIVRAADGNLYSASAGPTGTYVKITPLGNMTIISDSKNANFFGVIAEGPRHCIWGSRACSSGQCLVLYNVNRHGFVEYQFPASISALSGLIAGPDGNIWFQVYGQRSITDGLGMLNTY